MKGLARILDAWAEWKQAGGLSDILATVVKVEGSAYRRPGARMLLLPDRGGIGVISGGCLERHLSERAWPLTEAHPAVVTRYDTQGDADAFFGFGAGCQGVIHVLLERLDVAERATQMEFFEACRRQRRPGVMATLVGGKCADVGNRVMMFPDGSVVSIIGDPKVQRQLLEFARTCPVDAQPRTITSSTDSGAVEVFLEVIRPPVRLLVFGGGPDAPPLVGFAKELGWDVSVIDTRPTSLNRERFPLADKLILTTPGAVLRGVSVEPGTAAIIMSHDFVQDLAVLETLLTQPLEYLGVLGPRGRTERLLRELSPGAQGSAGATLRGLHAPVGLDIGSETPEEIALAVVAEIQATLRNRAGGKLRDREGPIHGRPPEGVHSPPFVSAVVQA